MRLAIAISLTLCTLAKGDELVLKNGKKIEWTSLKDLGDSVEVEVPAGTKLTVKKSEIDKVVFSSAPAPKPPAGEGAPAAVPEPGKPLEVPNAAAYTDAKKRLEKDYEEDYKAAKANRGAKKSLAAKMITASSSAEPTDRFVLLSEAMSLAAEGLDPTTAMGAAGELSKSFPVKVEELRPKVFDKVRSGKKAGDNERELADSYFQMAEKAFAAEDYEHSIALAREAFHPKTLAAPGLVAGFVNSCQQLVVEASEAQKEFDRAKSAATKLAASPDDAAANLERGRYLGFYRGNWGQANPFLSKSGDKYAAAGTAEASAPSDASSQLELAETWLAIAAKEKEPYRKRAAARSVHWYAQAWDSLNPPQQAKLEKSLAQAQELSGRINLFLVKATPKNGGWTPTGKQIQAPGTGHNNMMEISYNPPQQYDLEIHIQNPSCMMGIGASSPGMKLAVVLDGINGAGIVGVKDLKAPPAAIPQGKQSRVLIQVRAASVTVSLDGATLLDWKGNTKDLTIPPDWKVGTNVFYLSHHQNFAGGGSYKVLSLALIKK